MALVAAGGASVNAGCRRNAEPVPSSNDPSENVTTMSTAKTAPVKPMRIVEPSSGRADYALVMLHGVGADADSFLPIGRALAADLPHAVVLVPEGFSPFDGGGSGRQWFSVRGVTEENRPARVRAAASEVSTWLDGALAARGLAADRVVLLGFSQGAIVANYLAVHRTPRPMAVVSLSGRYADDAVVEAGAGAGGGVPVLVVHGARDPVIPVAEAAGAERALTARGARVTVRIEPQLAHGVDEAVMAEVRAFLKAEVVGP